MKNFIKISIFFIFNFCVAQSTTKIIYKQIYNTDSPRIRTGILQVNSTNSIFIDLISSNKLLKNNDDDITNNDSNSNLSFKIGGKSNRYYRFSLLNNNLSFIDEVADIQFLIEDKYKINWQITSESKYINNYKTYKAFSKFRGNVWEAWFAPDLAYPFGPWKLNGLPGIILEAYTTCKTYNYVATKIYTDDTQIDFPIENLKIIDFKNFILSKEEYLDNLFAIPTDRDVKVETVKSKFNSREFDFEWETPTK